MENAYMIIVPIYILMAVIVPGLLRSGYRAKSRNYKLGKIGDYISQKERNNRFLNQSLI